MDDRVPTSRLARLARLAVAGFLFLTTAVSAQDGPIKIAVVDLDVVVARSAGGQALQAKLEQFRKDFESQADALSSKAADLRRRIADGANSLSEDKLAELQKQFEDEQINLRRLRDDKQREGQKMQAEGLQEIERQLEPVFKKIQQEQGYDLILNNVPGVVVMASERIDITPAVIAQLDAGAGTP